MSHEILKTSQNTKDNGARCRYLKAVEGLPVMPTRNRRTLSPASKADSCEHEQIQGPILKKPLEKIQIARSGGCQKLAGNTILQNLLAKKE